MSADISSYLQLITSEHNQKPKFMALVGMMVQAFADNAALLNALVSGKFDLDTALGAQLDIIGLWVGVSRNLSVAITGTGFTWTTAGLGWGQGSWGDSGTTQVVRLDDAHYRTLLRAKIAANHWDGTIPGAYDVWNILFEGTGYSIQIVDNGDMTMQMGLIGPTPDALTLALFEGGYLDLRPAGVQITSYYTHT